MKQHYILITTLTLLSFGITCFGQSTTEDHDHDHDHLSTTEYHDDHDDHDHDHDHDHAHEEASTSDIWLAILITCFAGAAAFVGAFSIFFVKPQHFQIIPVALSFSAGVIIYLLFMNLIPESIELLTHITSEENAALARFYALLCVVSGLGITWFIESMFRKYGIDTHAYLHGEMSYEHNHKKNDDANNNTDNAQKNEKVAVSQMVKLQSNDPETVETPEDNYKEMVTPTPETNGDGDGDGAAKDAPYDLVTTKSDSSKTDSDNEKGKGKEAKMGKPANLSHLSKAVAVALVLHHFPEGIATFISLYYDLEFGLLVAIALAVHDIPSGICIAVPSYLATGSKKQPFMLCLVAALVYPIGAFIGWGIVEGTSEAFTEGFIGVLFGITAGIMLHIAFVELLPTAIITAHKYANIDKDSHKIFTMSIIGLFIGFLVIEISNILLQASGGHSH